MPRTAAILTRPHADRGVIWAVLALAAAGVVAVYSASAYLAMRSGDTELLLFKHVGRVLGALGLMGAVSFVDYRWLARGSKAFLMVSLGLLVLVQFIGDVTNGAQRWLDLGVVRFQPSDVAKVAVLLHVAVLLAKKQRYIDELGRGYVPLLAWIAPTILLIGIEDLSTAAVLSVTLGAMMFVGRVRVSHLAGTALIGLVLAGAFLAANPQRAARIEAWVGSAVFGNAETEQTLNTREEGYQAHQAQIAFAMGGLTGRGPGKSVQRDFLPAPYNDFIYAIVGEEYGLAGALVLLLVFVWLLLRGVLRVARGAPDPLGLFLAVGVTCAVVLGGFVNAAVASGLAPVTGLAMPFVSYGGTSMIATGVLVGLLLNVSRHVQPT